MKQKLNLRKNIKWIAFLSSVLLMTGSVSAEVIRLATKENISATKSIDEPSHGVTNLLDGRCGDGSKYHTFDEDNIENHSRTTFVEGAQYIQIGNTAHPLTLDLTKDYVVALQRCHNCMMRQPTLFRVMGSLNDSGDDWEEVANLRFLYRGLSTREYSARFQIKKNYKRLRFVCLDNNSRNYDADGNASMGLTEFQAFQLERGDKLPLILNPQNGEDQQLRMIDTFHHESDYLDKYEDYDFKTTMGWLDPDNRTSSADETVPANQPAVENGDINNEAFSKATADLMTAYYKRIFNWANWSEDWDLATGKWKHDQDKEAELKKLGYKLPDMSLITKDADFDASTSPDNPARQATHVMEHIIYAMPGDPVTLYPNYKMPAAKQYEKYEVNFSHWYDYRTGKRLTIDDGRGNKTDLLDFLVDPRNICITKNHGFYGCYLLSERGNEIAGLNSQNYGMFATFYYPLDPVKGVGENTEDPYLLPFRDIDEAKSDLQNDVSEFVIAADFSQAFHKNRNIKGNTIIEPPIVFRHLFRIRDGKTFADYLVDHNDDYIRDNTRRVTARANTEFQIGLDGGAPRPVRDKDGWWKSVPSNFYYRDAKGSYSRVQSMGIRVTGPNGEETFFHNHGMPGHQDYPFESTNTFYFYQDDFMTGLGPESPLVNALGSRDLEGQRYSTADGGAFRKGDGGIDYDIKFARFLKSQPNLSGKYTVEIIAEEIIGNNVPRPIELEKGNYLVLAKYEIDFVDNETSSNPQALLIDANSLYNDKKYEFAREEELIKRYGAPKDKIDFDYYRELEKLGKDKYFQGSKDYYKTYNEFVGDKEGETNYYRYKWPSSWEKSNYGFSFSEDHNYNLYRVANHSSMVPYYSRFYKEGKRTSQGGVGDLLWWKTSNLDTYKDEEGNQDVQNGYFLYVNGANDPGVIVTLNAGMLCKGSTINVSAWVCEFSNQPESANLVFNLVAVMKNTGQRIPIHSYVTGYVPNGNEDGTWYKIFYSIQPDMENLPYTSHQVDHYEIDIENNCKSSDGADYAIDEISLYIVTPVVTVEQEMAKCMDLDVKNDNVVKVTAPYSETLRSLDISESPDKESAQNLRIDYVVIDHNKFWEVYNSLPNDNTVDRGEEAFGTEGVVLNRGSELSLSTHYDSNPLYSTITEENKVGTYRDERNNRMFAFKVKIDDENFGAGNRYDIAFHIAPADEVTEELGWKYFDITDPCSKADTEFVVAGQNPIRVDGQVVPQTGPIVVCKNENPKISLDLTSLENGETKTHVQAACDWYIGSRVEFNNAKKGSLTLYKALSYFREIHSDVVSPSDISESECSEIFTTAMRSYLVEMEEAGKMIFGKNEYRFPSLTEGTDGKKKGTVVAIPIPYQNDGSDKVVCTTPTEVNVTVDEKSPVLLHGLANGVEYPDDISDVPLRIGLSQLKSVSLDEDNLPGKDETVKSLVIPLRKVEVSGVNTGVTSLQGTSDYIVLESTNDPDYAYKKAYKTIESEATGTSYLDEEEIIAGEIRRMDAGTTEGSDNKLSVVFYDSFTFREGYEYTFRYSYAEIVPETVAEAHTCQGENYFTIKVVPEYLVWSPSSDASEDNSEEEGTLNRNWNNDSNWRRVTSDELYADLTDADTKARLNDLVDDGSNKNAPAFAPASFTKVIIPSDVTASPVFPYLYGSEQTTLTGFADLPAGVLDQWTAAPSVASEGSEKPEGIGEPTDNIQYDMVAYISTADENVKCRAWYANDCGEIHFMPNSAIMNQQHLNYGRAWVDMEIDPARWYTLAMPFKTAYAGEFYLPKAGARQETELFQPIEFSTTLNDRFSPAVFQRGWDKGSAQTVLSDGTTTTAVVKANWSHVYNDVQESYGAGTGFSIKADVSRVANAPSKVLFRLPKADTEYLYYGQDDKEGSNGKTISRADHYRLNGGEGTITATTAGKEYFLVGNPFMTHLNMKKFLEENSDKIEQKYWLITSGSQKAAVFDAESEGFVGDAEGLVAPMQGFFVKAKGEAGTGSTNTLTLKYNESMMSEGSFVATSTPLKVATRSAQPTAPAIRIEAITNGRLSTSALVAVKENASVAYDAAEDMAVIDNTDLEIGATVYTVGDGKALAVNSLDAVRNVELGVIALPEEETVLRFSIEDDDYGDLVENLVLYDAVTGETIPLADGLEHTVTGKSAGRLFLTAGITEEVADNAISVSVRGEEVTVTAPTETLNVKVFDYSGRTLEEISTDSGRAQFTLTKGVYIIEAVAGNDRLYRRIMI